jgi:hypothetical protein
MIYILLSRFEKISLSSFVYNKRTLNKNRYIAYINERRKEIKTEDIRLEKT